MSDGFKLGVVKENGEVEKKLSVDQLEVLNRVEKILIDAEIDYVLSAQIGPTLFCRWDSRTSYASSLGMCEVMKQDIFQRMKCNHGQ